MLVNRFGDIGNMIHWQLDVACPAIFGGMQGAFSMPCATVVHERLQTTMSHVSDTAAIALQSTWLQSIRRKVHGRVGTRVLERGRAGMGRTYSRTRLLEWGFPEAFIWNGPCHPGIRGAFRNTARLVFQDRGAVPECQRHVSGIGTHSRT